MQIRMNCPAPVLATVAVSLLPALGKFDRYELEESLREHCVRLLKKKKGNSPKLPKKLTAKWSIPHPPK
jgi:hypothetical protein